MRTSLYGGIIEVGADGRPIVPDIVLAYRSGEKLGIIQNVEGFTHANHMTSAAEISFNVHKGEGENACAMWNELKDFKMAYIPHLALEGFNPWYELTVTIDEGNDRIKHCQGVHAHEAELGQLMLNDFEANTEDDIKREDYIPTVLYDPEHPNGSLLDRIINDKASHYSIAHVDASLANKQRTFSWNSSSILDAFNDIATELECLFVYGETGQDDGQIHRTISVYDLCDYCMECGERGTFNDDVCPKCGSTNIKYGFGEDTSIFITYENYAQNLNYTTNKDSVKNCFRLVAGDELMTATVINLNPSGSQYIWYLSDEARADMSPELQDRLADYDALYAAYENDEQIDIPEAAIDAYNELVDKYSEYDDTLRPCQYPVEGYAALVDLYYNALTLYSLLKTSLAPQSEHARPTSAAEQIRSLNVANLSPLGVSNAATISATTVNTVLLNYAKVYIDTSLYKASIEESEYANRTWTGKLRLRSYDDEDDTAVTSTLVITITDAEPEYMRCLIDKALKRGESDASTMVELFEKEENDFKETLHYYSAEHLDLLASLARGCLDVLIEQGQASPDAQLYQSMYLKYYNKSEWIQSELNDRESEIATLRETAETPMGLLDYIESARRGIIAELDLRSYLGEELWGEFCSHRRDDTYQNDNFISDGLSDTELIEMAQEFLKYAKREIIKSATLQHTITCDLNDFLLVRERDVYDTELRIVSHTGARLVTHSGQYIIREDAQFSSLNTRFVVGNWLHVEIDGRVYRLRMTDYELDYDNLDTIHVEFSDVTYVLDTADDLKSVVSKAKSMATSYNVTQKQANKGNFANEQIVNMVANGLDLTNKRIVNSAANQTLLVDGTGMLMRAKNDYDDYYSDEQVKIINHGLYYTNDNWRTVQAGIGKFVYYDVDTGTFAEDYGLIARKIVGNIIIGNDLGIYTQTGAMTMNADGFTVTTDATNVNQNLFTLRRKNADDSYTKYIYVDSLGHIRINGEYVQITADENLPDYVYNAVETLDESLDQNAIFNRLTNNGETQGLFMYNNKLYLNGSYMTTGTLDASVVNVTNLNASNINTGTLDASVATITNINASNINTGTLDASVVTVSNLSANSITTGTLDGSKATITNISASNIKTGTLDASKVTVSNLSASSITTGTLDGSKATITNISASNINTGTLNASTVTITNLNASNISSGTLSADRISAKSIGGAKIADGAITTDKIAANTIKASNIESGAITATMITSGTMSADRINGGTLTLGGSGNANGTLIIKNASGTQIGSWNNAGISINSGSININNNVFKVTSSGALTASNASITGSIVSLPQSGSDYYSTTISNGIITFGDGSYISSKEGDDGYLTIPMLELRDSNGAYFDLMGDQIYCGTYSSGSLCDMTVFGHLTVTGVKSRVVSTDEYSDRLLYCYETPSPMFGDVGEGVIGEDGLCYVPFDAVFAQTIASTQYQVFLQTYGDGQCWVQERNSAYFVVEGTPGLAFGWEVKAKQRDYDQLRLDRKDFRYGLYNEDYGEMAAQYIDDLMQERILT